MDSVALQMKLFNNIYEDDLEVAKKYMEPLNIFCASPKDKAMVIKRWALESLVLEANGQRNQAIKELARSKAIAKNCATYHISEYRNNGQIGEKYIQGIQIVIDAENAKGVLVGVGLMLEGYFARSELKCP